MNNSLFDDFPDDPLGEYTLPGSKHTPVPLQCYKTHPGLKMGDYTIYGGSASNPLVRDADIYVSLQYGSTSNLASYPWEKKVVTEVQYTITDGHAPKTVKTFGKLVDYIIEQMKAGKKVHVGCIGGHGRTGTLLAAVYAKLTGKKDAIQYVRKNYCKKAVESSEQVKFLETNYGVSHVGGSKFKHPIGSYSSNATTGFYTPPKKRPAGTSYLGQFSEEIKALNGTNRELIHVGGQLAPKRTIPMEFSVKSIWKARQAKG